MSFWSVWVWDGAHIAVGALEVLGAGGCTAWLLRKRQSRHAPRETTNVLEPGPGLYDDCSVGVSLHTSAYEDPRALVARGFDLPANLDATDEGRWFRTAAGWFIWTGAGYTRCTYCGGKSHVVYHSSEMGMHSETQLCTACRDRHHPEWWVGMEWVRG